jgi:HPt (histidine-containing phosphotransfer) domain-containing protein
MVTALLNHEAIAQIRTIESSVGRTDLFSGFVRKLEATVSGFSATFSDSIARGDTKGAERAAHTLKGICRQLGAHALGDLFEDIERSARAGNYAEAKRKFDDGAELISQSLEALRQA